MLSSLQSHVGLVDVREHTVLAHRPHVALGLATRGRGLLHEENDTWYPSPTRPTAATGEG